MKCPVCNEEVNLNRDKRFVCVICKSTCHETCESTKYSGVCSDCEFMAEAVEKN